MDMIQGFILVFAVTVNLLVGVMVYVRNPRGATNRLFALISVVLSFWSIANYLSVHAGNEDSTLLLVRIVMALATANSVLFFLLMHTFPRSSFLFSKRKLFIIALVCLATMGIALSPFLYTDIEGAGSEARLSVGPGMIPFVIVSILSIPLGLYYLIKKNMQAKGIKSLQLHYLLLGVVVMFILIIFFIFLNVAVFKDASFVSLSHVFTLPFVVFTAYAIIRYRLMDIRAAIARSISFSALLGSFFAIYGVILIFAVPYLARKLGVQEGIVAAIGALLAVVLARYLQDILSRVTDHFLYQRKVDYRRALEEASKRLSATIDIDDVTGAVLDILDKTVRSKKTIIFLRDNEGNNFLPRAKRGAGTMRVNIPKEHLLIKHIQHVKGPLVKDEMALEREQMQDEDKVQRLKEVEQIFDWLDVVVVLPLYVNKQLTGFIALGDKKAGTPYVKDDLNFLGTLAPQAATALENARLYQESLVFGEKLKTEVKRATHELEIANAQLRDLDKAKSEFLSIASHQLYTPMTALRGYLSMLQEGDYGKLDPKQKPIINILEKSTTRLIELIKNLLDVSRIESGRLQLNLESVDFSQMVKELVQDLMPNALNKKIKLQFHESEKDLSNVVVDQERVRQVILNIVDNAIKYTDKGRVDVRVQQTDHTVTLTVSDTGRGMTAEEMTKLFTKFTRVGGASQYRKEGTGLGLYVAKQIMREHHGDIEVTSSGMGEGSTFYVHLPTEDSPHSLKAGEKVEVEIKAGGQGNPNDQ